jgi:transcription antitermination factor NusG
MEKLNATGIATHPWYAIRSRSNAERSVFQLLQHRGLDPFLPSYRERRVWSDRIKEIDVPLFPGYLFCRFDFDNRLPILSTPGVLNIVGLGRNPSQIPEHEIEAVQRLLAHDLRLRPSPFLKVGNVVRIEYGPLAGLEGVLEEFRNNFRLVVSVTMLQRSVAAELDSAWIRPLSPSTMGTERIPTFRPSLRECA